MENQSKNPKKSTVLIVDDETKNVTLMEHLCQSLGLDTAIASNGLEAIDRSIDTNPDLILMDVMMPEMDGFEATERIKSDDKTKHIPIIILTALSSKEDRIKGISIGVNDFITKPFDMQELSLRIKNNLEIKEYHDFMKNHNEMLEIEVSNRTSELQNAYEKIDNAYKQVQSSYIETIQRLNIAAEYKDEETGAHIQRISLYARELAGALGMDFDFIERIYYASPMHDIGKVGIPDSVLLKQGSLTEIEWEMMKSHTTIGAKILSGSESHFLQMAEEIARTHHEKWDGSGYPRGLQGEEIPLSGRITNIVDQYDALRSKRPYKINLDHEEVMNIITKGDGRTSPDNFDPEILNVFKKKSAKMKEIYDTNCDD